MKSHLSLIILFLALSSCGDDVTEVTETNELNASRFDESICISYTNGYGSQIWEYPKGLDRDNSTWQVFYSAKTDNVYLELPASETVDLFGFGFDNINFSQELGEDGIKISSNLSSGTQSFNLCSEFRIVAIPTLPE